MAEQLTLEQSISEILPTLPQPIRGFLQKKKIEEVAQLITDRYALHIDHGAIIEHQLRLVLLGLEGPEEFATELFAQLPISEQTVRDILGDINKEIFVPLREEMRKGAPVATQPSRPAIQHPPLPRPAVTPSGGGPRPITEVRPSPNPPAGGHKVEPQMQQNPPPHRPATSAPYFHLQNKIPPAPPARLVVAPRPPVSNSNIAPLPPKSILPPSSPKLLRDREEPHIEMKKTAPPPPKPSFVPPNLPGVIQPPAPPVPPPPVVPPPPAKPYTTDPYREPIGGK